MVIRICLDANALLRAFAAPASPQATIIEALLGRSSEVQHFSSSAILAEWDDNSRKPSVLRYLARRGVDVDDYLQLLADVISVTQVVEPVGEAPPCRDEDDRKYLHLAVEASLDFVITADQDLLEIRRIGRCEIVTAFEFLEWD